MLGSLIATVGEANLANETARRRQPLPIPVTLDIVNAAAHLTQRHALRGYDAVQLAAGLSLNTLLRSDAIAITYVSGDEILLNAARSEGLAIENPFWHADLDGMRIGHR